MLENEQQHCKQSHLQLAKIQDSVLQLSHRNCRNFYVWSVAVGGLLTISMCLTKSVQGSVADKLFYCGGYILGVLVSYFAMWDFIEIHFRNLAGIVCAALLYPLQASSLFLKAQMEGNVAEQIGLMILCFGIPLLYGVSTKGYLILWPVIKYCGWYTLLKMPLYSWKRERELKRQERLDDAQDDFKRINKHAWQKIGKEERIQYIQQIVKRESMQLGFEEPVSCMAWNKSGKDLYDIEIRIVDTKPCMFWEEDAVMLLPLERIVQYMISTLQEYQWNQSLEPEVRRRLSGEQEEEQLLHRQMAEAGSGLSYDLVTWHYAKNRGDWYSGL